MSNRVKGGRGVLQISNAIENTMQEFNTLTCCHCNRIVVLNPGRTRDRNRCFRCNAYVCDLRACIMECNPIQEGIELGLKYPDLQQPWLSRGDNGVILFDTNLRDKERIF